MSGLTGVEFLAGISAYEFENIATRIIGQSPTDYRHLNDNVKKPNKFYPLNRLNNRHYHDNYH